MIHYENVIPVEDYLRLRDSVGWKRIAYEQAEKAFTNNLVLSEDRMTVPERRLTCG